MFYESHKLIKIYLEKLYRFDYKKKENCKFYLNFWTSVLFFSQLLVLLLIVITGILTNISIINHRLLEL